MNLHAMSLICFDFLQILTLRYALSMSSNFLASSGSWDRMSPPMKMPSKYSHLRCTTNHSSMISDIRAKLRSQRLTVSRNGPMNLNGTTKNDRTLATTKSEKPIEKKSDKIQPCCACWTLTAIRPFGVVAMSVYLSVSGQTDVFVRANFTVFVLPGFRCALDMFVPCCTYCEAPIDWRFIELSSSTWTISSTAPRM